MRHDLWRAILGARADLDKLVASAVGDYPSQPPPRALGSRPAPRAPSAVSGTSSAAAGPRLVRGSGGAAMAVAPAAVNAPRAISSQDTARLWIDPAQAAPVATAEHETLRRLHQDAHARVELLRGVLAPEPGGEQATLALVLYFDEYIMGLLPDFLATSWPLLQTRLTGRKTGGSDFFRLIDRLLETESSPALAIEIYYFCLRCGFQGQYADDLAALERYEAGLRARIAAPEPASQPRRQPRTASPEPMRSPALYYIAAVLLVVLTAVALTVGSNQ